LGVFELQARIDWYKETVRSFNDTLNITYEVRLTNDVGISQHNEPINGDTLFLNDIVKPKVILANYGIERQEDFSVIIHIYKSQNDQVFHDTMYGSKLDAGESLSLESTKYWQLDDVGTYTFKSYLASSDLKVSNDSLSSQFLVVRKYDVFIQNEVLPEKLEGLSIVRNHFPSVKCINDGFFEATDVEVNCQSFIGDSLIYIDSKLIALQAGESQVITFEKPLFWYHLDSAKMVFSITHTNSTSTKTDTLSYNYFFTKGLGIHTLEELNFQLFPNPAGSSITLRCDKPMEHIAVLNSVGKIVEERIVEAKQAELNLELPQGIYYLHIVVEGQSFIRKFVK
jgi:hypothetical protein